MSPRHRGPPCPRGDWQQPAAPPLAAGMAMAPSSSDHAVATTSWCCFDQRCLYCGGSDYVPGPPGPRSLVPCDCCTAEATHIECFERESGQPLPMDVPFYCSEVGGSFPGRPEGDREPGLRAPGSGSWAGPEAASARLGQHVWVDGRGGRGGAISTVCVHARNLQLRLLAGCTGPSRCTFSRFGASHILGDLAH